jgi:hypothetical protein
MPDAASGRWLAEALVVRDREHARVNQAYGSEYARMENYIGANLYSVATPPGVEVRPRFLLDVANPILVRHWRGYLRFGFRFWKMGLSRRGLARIRLPGIDPWAIYATLGLLALWLRDRHALLAATLLAGHLAHVALAAFFAAPLERMVWASEVLVVLAAGLLFLAAAGKIRSSFGRGAEGSAGGGT